MCKTQLKTSHKNKKRKYYQLFIEKELVKFYQNAEIIEK